MKRIVIFLILLSAIASSADVPLLIVGSTSHPFTSYYNEVTRTEGLNGAHYLQLSAVSQPVLSGYKVVLLGSMPLSAAQVSMFTAWVESGGKLVAMRPDKQLASLLGLTDTGATLNDGYLAINTDSSPGAGLVSDTIQFHGTADLYTRTDALAVATLYSTATTSTPNPAVTIRAVGENGGEAVAFTYDLARSVVYTRQGNPLWSDQERDGILPVRGNDLFFGNAGFDPRPDWIDRNKVGIPQADEQQRLLANVILHVTRDRLPVPRFWYFPFFKKAVIVMTGDDHASGGTAGRFDANKAASPAGCVVGNWECIRSTSYIYASTPITDAQALTYTNEGFEVGIHVDTGCQGSTTASLEPNYTSQISSWRAVFPSIPAPITHRTHCIAWGDYDTQPQLELTKGIRLDTNYYYYPGGSTWMASIPGYFTGSGMPMRFTKIDGTSIDVYQATTQMTDESQQTYPAFATTLLDNALGSKGFYAALTANIHTDSNTGPSETISNQIVAAAKARGVPVVSAKQMLTWLDARNGSTITGMTWNETALALGFTITPAAGSTGLRGLLPARYKTSGLSRITRNGGNTSYAVEFIKGNIYAVFDAVSGVYQATYVNSSATVTINPLSVSLSAGQSQQFTATVTGGDPGVIWSITPSIGTISPTGLYTAPAVLTTADQITVTAFSIDDASKSASAVVQLFVPTAPPVISSVTSSATANSATITWVTDELSTSVVNYGTAPNQLTLSATVPTLVKNHTVTLPGLTLGTRYYYRVSSADSGNRVVTWPPATSPAANFLAAATVSIWAPTVQPSTTHVSDTSPVELGVKFRSTSAGYVTGVRFYKGTGNDGIHIGSLWTSTGTRLAQVTFASESIMGWQEASFVPPAPVTANTTYVISYHAPQAAYAFDGNYFASTGVVNGPLQALQSGVDGGNGVFRYSDPGEFPDLTFNAANYWVDVLFTTSIGGDTTAPVITGVSAAPSATSAIITWTTDDASSSVVAYGTSPTALTSTATGPANVTSHSVTLSGLTQGVVYYYRVTSVNSENLSATSPTGDPASFTAQDTTPPVITAISAAPGTTTATITWTTDEPASSAVAYGTSPTSLTSPATGASNVTSHSVTLSGLTQGTVYYYRVTSVNAASLSATEPTGTPATFTTLDGTPPVITAIQAVPGTTTATITWTTNEASSTFVDYGTAPGNLLLTATGAANVTSHSVTLSGLSQGAVYYYRVRSADAAGNSATAPATPATFTTVDNTPPVITSLTATRTATTATITWTTNEPSNSTVLYGLTANLLIFNANDAAMVTAHTVVLTGLLPSTTYYYRVRSTDAANNTATFPTGTGTRNFTTLAADAPPIITAVAATVGGDNAIITWTTNENATTRVEYGTSPSLLSLVVNNTSRVIPHTATLTNLTRLTTYYYRVMSTDAGGNTTSDPPTGSPPRTFTTKNTATIWPVSAVPGKIDDGDTQATEVGLKFRADVAGTISGIRFYKAATNTGAHVGNLWTAAGALLASVPFTEETASGWQQADFAAPVSITAGATYIVSYHAPAGHYSANINYFNNTGRYNAPLYALRNGLEGSNGVYLYGPSGFPTQTFNSSNYWVDAVFIPAAPLPVTEPVTSVAMETGTAITGTTANLTADDNSFLTVSSTTTGTRTTAWSVTFTGIPRTAQSIRLAYVGKNSRNCTETISILQPGPGTWLQLHSSTVGTAEVLRNLTAPGSAAAYVSGSAPTGDVRVRIACTTTANFTASADSLSLSYVP